MLFIEDQSALRLKEIDDENEEAIKTLAQNARNTLYVIYAYLDDEACVDKKEDIAELTKLTPLLPFISRTLAFYAPRLDTYSEIYKDQATSLLILMSSVENDETTSGQICNPELQLLEVFGTLLTSDQLIKIKLNVLWVLSNLIAEPDFNIRNQVIDRSKLIEYFDSILQQIPKELITTVPWVLLNIFKGGLTFATKHEFVVSFSTLTRISLVDDLLEITRH